MRTGNAAFRRAERFYTYPPFRKDGTQIPLPSPRTQSGNTTPIRQDAKPPTSVNVGGLFCHFFEKRVLTSQQQQNDAYELKDAAEQDKDVPNAVHVTLFAAESVKDDAHCIEHAARQQPQETRQRNAVQEDRQNEYDHPAHDDVTDVADHLDRLPLHVDGVEGDAEESEPPFHRKDDLADGQRPEGDEAEGRVATRDQQENGAMVKDAEDALRRALDRKSVV